MSFAGDIKKELSETKSFNSEELIRAELLGYLLSNNINVEKEKTIFVTESEYNINRFAKLLNKLNIDDYDISINGNKYSITVKLDIINIDEEIKNISEECKRALIRGAYLGSGWMSDPTNTYHLELSLKNIKYKEYVEKILLDNNIEFKTLKREKRIFALYKRRRTNIKFTSTYGSK